MKMLILVGVLTLTLSGCSQASQSPTVEESMPPVAVEESARPTPPAVQESTSPATGVKTLSKDECKPLVFSTTNPDGSEDELSEIQKITSAALDLFVDASEKDATACANSMGLTVRITSRDGEQFMGTKDYLPTRVNFDVERDVVIAATVG